MKCRGVGFYVPPFAVSLLFKVAEEEMVQTGVKITEGLCMGILARSTESKFLCFAEEVAKHCREKCMMAIAMYGAWMRGLCLLLLLRSCLRSVPAGHREQPLARSDHVRLPHARLRAARQG